MTHTISTTRRGRARPERWRTRRLLFTIALSVLAAILFAPASALALSEGRVYEMVSPVYKGGYGAAFTAAAPNSESVLFNSLGAFAGIPFPEAGSAYVAHREAGKGWVTIPAQPPFKENEIGEFSSTLEYAFDILHIGENEDEPIWHRLATPDTPEDWEVFGGGAVIFKPLEEVPAAYKTVYASPQAASNDLCHVVVLGAFLLPESPYRGKTEGAYSIYDVSRGCRGEGAGLRLVGVRNSLGPHGEPAEFRPGDECAVELGFSSGAGGPFGPEQTGLFNPVSGDGSEIFFTANVEGFPCKDRQVFVRLGGSRTVEVSRPVEPSLAYGGCGEGGSAGEVPGEVPCPGAVSRAPAFFKGASEDGSRVFFTSGATLVPGDTDNSNKLFLARIGCPVSESGCEPAQRRVIGLVDASQSRLAGEDAEVQGVVSMGAQAGYVYFVAHGVLTSTANGEGVVAVKGADNLYVYSSETGSVAFIGDLCSGPRVSGTSETLRCPSSLGKGSNDQGLWAEERGSNTAEEAQSTGDGRFLVFSSFAKLIVHGTQGDADSARDVYRYDAQTGVIDRVSLGENGHDTNGNNNGFDATIPKVGINPGGKADNVVDQQELSLRAVSEDGSRIVFSSSEPLSVDAINGQGNVYIWHKEPGWGEGRVSIVSSGSSFTDDVFPVISLDGMDVFFGTSVGLVPVDTEHDLDVYDARVGGGFPLVAAEREPCSSDACQGALTNPVPLLVPGSVSQASGQNYLQPASKRTVKKAKRKVKSRKRAKARKAGRAWEGSGRGVSSGRSRVVVLRVAGRSGR